jgi:outer membrane receptor protein involved in Fe transport
MSPFRLHRIITCSLILGIVLTGAVAAQSPGGTLRGRVTEVGTGTPIDGAIVTTRSTLGTVVRIVMTDDAGRFVVDALSPGVYTIDAGRIGYGIASRPDVVFDGGDVDLDFALPVVALEADEVVVAANRRVERVVDSDATVGTIRGDRIRERAEPTLFGALRGLKGLDTFSSGLGQQQPNARGFVNPFTSNMLFLVDQRLSSMPGLGTVLPGMVPATQEDVAQIDVVTGPTSALYGPNAGNGVINIVTRDPGEGARRSLSLMAGERASLRAAARFSGTLGSRFAWKASGEVRRADDFERVNTFTGANGFAIEDAPDFTVRNRSLSGSLYFYPTPGSRIIYSAGTTQASWVNLTVVSRLQVSDWVASYHQLRAHVADIAGLGSFFLQGYYTKNDAGHSYYLDILARNQIPQQYGGPGLTADAAMQRALFVDRSDRFDLEMQHSKPIGTAHTFTSGVQWRRIRPNSGGTYLTDGPLGEPIRITEWGAYVGYENRSIANLRLTAIGRYDHHSDFGSRFSPKVAASWAFAPDQTLRVGFNQAFNSPTTYLLYAQSFTGRTPDGYNVMVRGNRSGYTFVNELGGATPDPLPRLEPLSIRSWEAGYRGVYGGRLFVDGVVYRSTYENYISKETVISRPADGVFAIDPRTGQPLHELTRTYLNYGELPTVGADLGVQWLPVDAISLSAGFSWQQAGDFVSPLEGLDPPSFNAPERKLRGGIAWAGWWRPGSSAELDVLHVEDYFFLSSLPYLTATVPSYTVVDVSAGVPIALAAARQSRLTVSVRNLLDSHHFEIPGGARLGRIASVGLSVSW